MFHTTIAPSGARGIFEASSRRFPVPAEMDWTGAGKYNRDMSDASGGALCIRRYRPDDANCLHRIDQVCFAADIAYTRGELLFCLSHPLSITLIAERNGKIIGFAVARVLQNRLAHILTLDVLPEARRQRIGTLLMSALHEEFKKRVVTHVSLEVSKNNPAARRLYEALQYRVVETLQGYYNGREDAYRMVLSL